MATSPFWVETEDWHTAGEPFRIVRYLPAHCWSYMKKTTVADQRLDVMSTPNHPLDLLRQSLCYEPRGHADMYGGFILRPNDSGAHFGVLFWNAHGFSTACGHGTIALGRWALANKLVKSHKDGTEDVVIDVPSGRVVAQLCFQDGLVICVNFINVKSYQTAENIPVTIGSGSDSIHLQVDLSFGGALCASVDVTDLALHVERKNYDLFIKYSRQIKTALGPTSSRDVYDLAAICFFETVNDSSDAITQRNVVVVGDGQVDRSPCGSGTCARLAILLAQGKVSRTKKLIHHSIIGTTFEGVIMSAESSPTSFPACIPRVSGNANLTGRNSFYIDPSESVYPGFLFR